MTQYNPKIPKTYKALPNTKNRSVKTRTDYNAQKFPKHLRSAQKTYKKFDSPRTTWTNSYRTKTPFACPFITHTSNDAESSELSIEHFFISGETIRPNEKPAKNPLTDCRAAA
jgi:hypothetical protein